MSFARFGTSVSGGASNLSSGGIGVGFDFETGKCKDFGVRYKKFCPDGEWIHTEHPDTHVIWKDTVLPNWTVVRNKIQRVCEHISSLDYLGLDVIITPEGCKFCEINTHPAADYAQIMSAPILADAKARAFYESKGLFNFDRQAFYEMYVKSQETNN